jgi:hypothetical protein
VVPAVGDSDLSQWIPAEYPERSAHSPQPRRDPPSLAELIRAGDADALAGFRDANAGRVRGYCAEACRPDLVEEAVDAAFAELVGRLRTRPEVEVEVEVDELLIKATRSAAAGRFAETSADATCLAVPELLAAHANGELRSGEERVTSHVERCPVCTATAIRMLAAERAFAP